MSGYDSGSTMLYLRVDNVMKVPDGDALERKGMCVYVGSASVYACMMGYL